MSHETIKRDPELTLETIRSWLLDEGVFQTLIDDERRKERMTERLVGDPTSVVVRGAAPTPWRSHVD